MCDDSVGSRHVVVFVLCVFFFIPAIEDATTVLGLFVVYDIIAATTTHFDIHMITLCQVQFWNFCFVDMFAFSVCLCLNNMYALLTWLEKL